VTAIQKTPALLPPAAADRAAGVRLKVKDKRPSINNRSEQSIYPTQKSVLRTEATPVFDRRRRQVPEQSIALQDGLRA
jgi:hypothetical protein